VVDKDMLKKTEYVSSWFYLAHYRLTSVVILDLIRDQSLK